jgi:hypothetical protein
VFVTYQKFARQPLFLLLVKTKTKDVGLTCSGTRIVTVLAKLGGTFQNLKDDTDRQHGDVINLICFHKNETTV